jgi:hypothetical protein
MVHEHNRTSLTDDDRGIRRGLDQPAKQARESPTAAIYEGFVALRVAVRNISSS